MDVNNVLSNISARQRELAAVTEINRNLVFDVGALTAWDPNNVTLPKAGPEREDYFRQTARDNTQELLNKLYSIEDTQLIEGERVLNLPQMTTILPRAKPLPQPKQETKWERFAREKGIKSKSSKNRDKLVWDDAADKFVPRYGYQKAKNEIQKDWLIEIPDQKDPNVDYFAQKNEEKKERVAKNKYQQLRNQARAQNVK